MGTFESLVTKIIDMGISKTPSYATYGVFTYLQNGHFLIGKSKALGAGSYSIDKQELDFFTEKRPIGDLVGFDCFPHFAFGNFWKYWFKDYKCIDITGHKTDYYLPSNMEYTNIVGIGISRYANEYYWFDDPQKVYWRKPTNTRTFNDSYDYSLPRSPTTGQPYEPSDIVGMAIAHDYCYAWYKDGYVSYGSSKDLDRESKPKSFTIPLKLEVEDVDQLFRDKLGERINQNTQFIHSSSIYDCPKDIDLKPILRREKVAREKWVLEEEGNFSPGLLVKGALLREVYTKNLLPYHLAAAVAFGDNAEETIYILSLNYEKEIQVIDPKSAKLYEGKTINQMIPASVRFKTIIL